MVICLERGADLHMAQLMQLPLTVSCSSKIQIGFTFLVPAYPGCPGKKRPLNGCCCCCSVFFHCRIRNRPNAIVQELLFTDVFESTCVTTCTPIDYSLYTAYPGADFPAVHQLHSIGRVQLHTEK